MISNVKAMSKKVFKIMAKLRSYKAALLFSQPFGRALKWDYMMPIDAFKFTFKDRWEYSSLNSLNSWNSNLNWKPVFLMLFLSDIQYVVIQLGLLCYSNTLSICNIVILSLPTTVHCLDHLYHCWKALLRSGKVQWKLNRFFFVVLQRLCILRPKPRN